MGVGGSLPLGEQLLSSFLRQGDNLFLGELQGLEDFWVPFELSAGSFPCDCGSDLQEPRKDAFKGVAWFGECQVAFGSRNNAEQGRRLDLTVDMTDRQSGWVNDGNMHRM